MEELKKEGEFIENKYIPKDPEKVILSVTDHVGLIQPSNGRNRKGEIDDYTNKLVIIRNKTGLSPIIVMQSNRAVANMERKRMKLSWSQWWRILRIHPLFQRILKLF